jgi:alanine racemase
MQDTHHSTEVLIDLQAYENNVRYLKQLAPNSLCCAVLKADAYGHGIKALAPIALKGGADVLGIVENWEANAIRDLGLNCRILRLRPALLEEAAEAQAFGVEEIVGCIEDAQALANIAPAMPLRVHVKIDTGMGRTGIVDPEEIVAIAQLPHLRVVGAMTHFPSADSDRLLSLQQLHYFTSFFQTVRKVLPVGIILHAANSAAAMHIPEAHLDMIRVGISSYGVAPNNEFKQSSDLRAVMSWQTRVASVRTIAPGTTVGYGSTFTAPSKMRIATLPIGYADGFCRRMAESGNANVLIAGKRQRVVGRASMNMLTIDVSNTEIAAGDAVVLLGKQGDQEIAAEELAARIGTIGYEITCAVGSMAHARRYV